MGLSQQPAKVKIFVLGRQIMQRLLLLIPSTTYRALAFIEAANKLDVSLVVATDEMSTLEAMLPHSFLTLNFKHPQSSLKIIQKFHEKNSLDAIVSVDEEAMVAAQAIAECLSLSFPHNSSERTAVCKNKHQLREVLTREGFLQPNFKLFMFRDSVRKEEPKVTAKSLKYPVVIKPTNLSASRGVIRANDEEDFLKAFNQLRDILNRSEFKAKSGKGADYFLVEDYISGEEYALEGLLVNGKLSVMALFDKPDPLSGPYFEETIYVTPSRLNLKVQLKIFAILEQAAKALGLKEGPVHAEVRLNNQGVWILELAPRSIGGLCSRSLHFLNGASLEEIILRHALKRDFASIEREAGASGVMMIPIPKSGVLKKVLGKKEAEKIFGIDEVVISIHQEERIEALPVGGHYLGFIFARSKKSEEVEEILRKAHACLKFVIES